LAKAALDTEDNARTEFFKILKTAIMIYSFSKNEGKPVKYGVNPSGIEPTKLFTSLYSDFQAPNMAIF